MRVKYPVPDEALEADIAILGKKGRGKTYCAKGIVERLLDMKRRVIVLDPLSTWWGLKARATGQEGYPIVVFGGPHADVELDDGMGRGLGRFLAKEGHSAVIDLGLMRKAEQARVVADLLEELFTHNRDPIWLVLEEADAFAPQQPMGDTSTRVLGEVDRIARRGRAFGFRLISISQRAAKLHKDVLTQLSTLIALGVTSPQDRDAVKSWVEGNADRDQAREVMQSMASLEVGEGWVWAPDLDLLKRVKFPRIKTLDTSATPRAGEKRQEPKRLAQADLTRIQAALQQESGNSTKKSTAAPGDAAELIKQAEQRGFERGRAEATELAQEAARALADRVRNVLDDASAVQQVARPEIAATRPRLMPAAPAKVIEGLTGPESKLLGALAWWEAVGKTEPNRAMVGAIAGWRVTSGHLKNVSGSLSSKGLICYPTPGRMSLTDQGRAMAPPVPTTSLHDMVRAILTGPQRAAFEALLSLGDVTREQLCSAVGWNPSSGHPKNVLGSLSSMEIVEYPAPGRVRLVAWLN